MGTHPIFESDFDCLTDERNDCANFAIDFARMNMKRADFLLSSLISSQNGGNRTAADFGWREHQPNAKESQEYGSEKTWRRSLLHHFAGETVCASGKLYSEKNIICQRTASISPKSVRCGRQI